jgi:predicted  nucleic acid-binding Zn-ribbon protein
MPLMSDPCPICSYAYFDHAPEDFAACLDQVRDVDPEQQTLPRLSLADVGRDGIARCRAELDRARR